MLIVAAAQTNWKSPRALHPLLLLGQYSYEVYLTHMFVVFALFHLFLRSGGHVAAVPVLFLSVVVVSGLLGGFVARTLSEPVNQFIRIRWRSPQQAHRLAERA
jgi:peptidoglycan/LPS O-acetylase OafA/YrhL